MDKWKLNEKLAKWVGSFDFTPDGRYEAPDGEWNTDFTDSFDACLKWLVPKLQDKGYQIDIVCFEHKGFAVSPFYVLDDQTRPLIDVRDDSLALALCLAIEKLIDGKVSGSR